MVEIFHTTVASTAVTASEWAKDVTRRAEFGGQGFLIFLVHNVNPVNVRLLHWRWAFGKVSRVTEEDDQQIEEGEDKYGDVDGDQKHRPSAELTDF